VYLRARLGPTITVEDRQAILNVRPPRQLWRTVLLLTFALSTATMLRAQISPGPLSRAHKSLDTTSQCTTCHRFGAETSFRCLECHAEIAGRMSAHRGLHPNLVNKPGADDCARCHSEHNGENFNLIVWDQKAFDHSKAGYPLLGKHAGVACSQCHNPQHIATGERTAIKVNIGRTFLGLSQACSTCHQDPHAGRLGENCLQCHSFDDWKKVNKFDHGKTRYPLTGMHVSVACARCHTPGVDNKPRYSGLPFAKCSDCHSDPHHGTFAQQSCQSCHNTSGWKRVATAAISQSFDHSKTKFPLEGKHAGVDCLRCHAGGDFKKPLVFAKCMDCHTPDPHNGQFAKRSDGGECASCHTVEGWKPSKFTVKEHAATAYPLQGKHAALRCEQCHIPKGKETLYKIRFARCTDCHGDQHQAQFAIAPYLNRCEQCHTLDGYRPSTFTLALHKNTRFLLTGSHLAIPCNDCHKATTAVLQPAAFVGARQVATYHWSELSCTTCHADPHKGQFRERMLKAVAEGKPLGCETCHSTKNWKEVVRFDHSTTSFPLVGAHRAVECSGCHRPPRMETKLTNVDFKAAPAKCEECHQDVHAGQFANAQRVTPCVSCHNSTRWKPSLFDHDLRTTFPLKGAHANVRCGQCHQQMKNVDGRNTLLYNPTPKECAACHGALPPTKSTR